MLLAMITKMLRLIGQIVLAGTVLVAPWFLGSLYASVQQWLFYGVIAALCCGIITLLTDTKTRFQVSLLIVPLLLFVLLIGLQLRTLDFKALQNASPKAAELREKLLPAPGSAELALTQQFLPDVESNQSAATPSVYPAATRHLFSLFVFVCGFFVAAQILFIDRIPTFVFLIAIAANGVTIAFIGIVMRIAVSNGREFLGYVSTPGYFSSFLNRNNAAGYLGMCLGAAIVLLLWYLFKSDRAPKYSQWDENELSARRKRHRKHHRHSHSYSYHDSSRTIWARLTPIISGGILTWLLIAGIIIAGILISFSRGGSIAMMGALLVGTLAILAVRQLKLSLIGLLAIGLFGVGLVLWSGMDERVQKRLETIFTEDNLRPVNWHDAWATTNDFQWRGAGFGTYPYANLLNDEFSANNQVFVHAENQYVEIFCELGIMGFLVLILCIVLAFFSCGYLLLSGKDEWLVAVGGGALVALVTQLLASIFDYGLYTSANTILLATLFGMVTAITWEREGDESNKASVFSLFGVTHRIGLGMIAVLFLTLLFWGQKEIKAVAVVDSAYDRLKKITDFKNTEPKQLADAINELESALKLRPDSGAISLALAEARINLYRLSIFQELLAQSDNTPKTVDLTWRATSLNNIHQKLSFYRNLGFTTPVEMVQNHPMVEPLLVPAFCDLVRARQSCPLLVQTHLYLAEIVPMLDKKNQQRDFEQKSIKRATSVAPLSARVWYVCGNLESNLGRGSTAENNLRHQKQARAYWRQSISLSTIYFSPITQNTLTMINPENASTILTETFPDSPDIYLRLLGSYFSERQTPLLFPIVLEGLRESVPKATDLEEGKRHYYLGRYAMLKKEYPTAVDEFKLACQDLWNNDECFFWLANAYQTNQQYKEALEAIDRAIFFNPKNAGYKKLRDTVQLKVVTQ